MPLYFVDFQDGEDLYYDAVGSEFKEFKQVCRQAIIALKEIAKDRPKNTKHHEVIVFIRNESEKNLYKATLKLYGQRCSVTVSPEARLGSRQLSELRTVQGSAEGLSNLTH